MLDYKIVNYKADLVNPKTNERYIDLMSGSYNTSKIDSIQGHYIIINKYYVARPDLISLAVYGDDAYGDILCKINGISNPFELNEDIYFFIPSVEFINNCCTANNVPSELITDDTERINNTLSIEYQKPKNAKRSPNEQTIGDKNFIIDKTFGMVLY